MNALLDFIDVFIKGGVVMYPLLLCSVIAGAVAVERFVYYRRSGEPKAFWEKVYQEIEQGEWTEVIASAKRTKGAVASVLAAGLRSRGNLEEMKIAFEGAAALEAANLRKHLGYLDTIVTLAPLLGLLGTVTGMIRSFSVLNIQQGASAAITGGVGEALIATAAGLCVAVLALVIHSYFNHRLDAIITEMERICLLVLERTRGEAV